MNNEMFMVTLATNIFFTFFFLGLIGAAIAIVIDVFKRPYMLDPFSAFFITIFFLAVGVAGSALMFLRIWPTWF